MLIFSIRDLRAEAHNLPFYSPTRSTAMREIQLGLQQDPKMRACAADFSLFEIGSWDATTGRLTPRDPHHVCDVIELVANQDESPS